MSDILLGHSQFGQSEWEKDMQESFEEAIDESVVEHSRLAILAGDLFTCLIEWFVNNKIGNELFIISILYASFQERKMFLFLRFLTILALPGI